MSKKMIFYVTILILMIVVLNGVIPYVIKETPSNMTKKKQMHVITGVYEANINPVEVSEYKPISIGELKSDDHEFFSSILKDRGVYKKNNVVLLTLGQGVTNQKITFSHQDLKGNEVRIYVKVKKNSSAQIELEPSYLLGEISITDNLSLSFIDEETGNLLY